jgi:lipopolysaccharide/colanic/teichoic acid biosynthesis glycosyltransferase
MMVRKTAVLPEQTFGPRLRRLPVGRHPRPAYIVAKEPLDRILAFIALVLLAPLLAVIAVLIRLDSPGPALFRQTRIGLNGTHFRIFKFRTMHEDAEVMLDLVRHLNVASPPLFKAYQDPRVTRVGKWLRRLSLDELPQLWNVLKGEMSLVGPRPALPDEVALWTPELYERLLVKPGITGLWQISGRSNCSTDEYVHWDLFYVHNCSIATDLRILVKTIPAVLNRRGAL